MKQPETTVLTIKQQRIALSGKKSKNRDQSGHSVFTSPYSPYWPVLGEDAEEDLNQLLISILQPIRKPAIKVNWSELRKVPCKQRREMRMKLQQESHVPVSSDCTKELRQCLLLGVNTVTRGLESSLVGCVLLAHDADPRMLISHIPIMCAMQGVPVLIMSSLRSIVNTTLGFSCLALGIKRSAVESEGGHFHTLFKTVMELCKTIPVPEPLPAFCYALSHGPTDDQAEKSSDPQPTEVKVSADVYKYRSSRKERAFVPRLPSSSLQPSVDFLSLDMGTDTVSNKVILGTCVRKFVDEPMDVQDKGTQIMCRQPQFQYQPLRLKQAVPNPKKIRKKEIKKRRK